MSDLKLITKIQIGPYGKNGIHYAKKMFWKDNEWHYLKWVSRREVEQQKLDGVNNETSK